MAKKNAAAVELGRKGGKVTGRKGLAAMDPEDAKRIRSLGGKARWAGVKKKAGTNKARK